MGGAGECCQKQLQAIGEVAATDFTLLQFQLVEGGRQLLFRDAILCHVLEHREHQRL